MLRVAPSDTIVIKYLDIVMTGQRRVDPLAAIFIRQNQSGNGQRGQNRNIRGRAET